MGKRFRNLLRRNGNGGAPSGITTATLTIDLNAAQPFSIQFHQEQVNGALVVQALGQLRDQLIAQMAIQQMQLSAQPQPIAAPLQHERTERA